MAAVRTVVPVVAHDVVVTFWHDLWTEVVSAPVLLGYKIITQGDVVYVDLAVHDAHLVALLSDDPLNERRVRVKGVVEHHNIAAARFTNSVGKLVNYESVLVLKCWRHALAIHSGYLESESDDERCVHGRRPERFKPGDELLSENL